VGSALGLLQVIPGLIGAFAAAAGAGQGTGDPATFRYTLDPGPSGGHGGAVANLVPLAVVVTLAAGKRSACLSPGIFQPIFGAGR